MDTLTVVNQMLGTLGEKPLNSLTDTHRFLAAALDMLEENNRAIQGKGWWFNMEEVTLEPSPIDQSIYLPNDCLSIRPCANGSYPNYPTHIRNYVKRGDRVYNLNGGTFEFSKAMRLMLIRQVEFEDLPDVAATYIAARAVYEFQVLYDGDTAKTRTLETKISMALIDINTEHTRSRHTNLIDSNFKLRRLKALTNGSRRYIR